MGCRGLDVAPVVHGPGSEDVVVQPSFKHGRGTTAFGHTAGVGFDPTRRHRRTNFDYFYVAAGLVVCVALVLWALLG